MSTSPPQSPFSPFSPSTPLPFRKCNHEHQPNKACRVAVRLGSCPPIKAGRGSSVGGKRFSEAGKRLRGSSHC